MKMILLAFAFCFIPFFIKGSLYCIVNKNISSYFDEEFKSDRIIFVITFVVLLILFSAFSE